MQITKKDYLKLSIITEHVASPQKTFSEIAKEYGTSKSTVNNAIQWGSNTGLLNSLLGKTIGEHLLRLKRHLTWLEKHRAKYDKAAEENATTIPPSALKAISQEFRETLQLFLELEGLKTNVAVKHEHELSLSPELQESIDKLLGDNQPEIVGQYTVVSEAEKPREQRQAEKLYRQFKKADNPYSLLVCDASGNPIDALNNSCR